MDGAGGLDGGGGVAAVHHVGLCVLSLAVDHRDAQTETRGERLSPERERENRPIRAAPVSARQSAAKYTGQQLIERLTAAE